jgi:hypothetical protein
MPTRVVIAGSAFAPFAAFALRSGTTSGRSGSLRAPAVLSYLIGARLRRRHAEQEPEPGLP